MVWRGERKNEDETSCFSPPVVRPKVMKGPIDRAGKCRNCARQYIYILTQDAEDLKLKSLESSRLDAVSSSSSVVVRKKVVEGWEQQTFI